MRKIIVWFPEDKIKAEEVVKKGSNWESLRSIESDSEPAKLKDFFERLTAEFAVKKISIVLPVAKTWLGLISFPTDAHVEFDDILQRAAKESGINLSADFFDWKWVETSREKIWYQCLGVEDGFIRSIIEIIAQTKLKIEVLTEESFAAAALLKEEKPTFFKVRDILIASWRECVLGRLSIGSKDEKKQEEVFIREIGQRWGVELEENREEIPNPIFGVVQKAFSKKNGLKMLSFLPGERESRICQVEAPREKRRLWIWGFGGLLLVTIGFVSWYLSGRMPNIQTHDQLQPTVAAEPATEEPTESVDVVEPKLSKDIKISVLNGSGEAGVAGKGRDFLSARGFENIEIGNAGKYDYVTTLVQYKPELEGSIGELVEILNESYKAELDQTLTEEAVYDVVVIIGLE